MAVGHFAQSRHRDGGIGELGGGGEGFQGFPIIVQGRRLGGERLFQMGFSQGKEGGGKEVGRGATVVQNLHQLFLGIAETLPAAS